MIYRQYCYSLFMLILISGCGSWPFDMIGVQSKPTNRKELSQVPDALKKHNLPSGDVQYYEWAENKYEASPKTWFKFLGLKVGWGDRLIFNLNGEFIGLWSSRRISFNGGRLKKGPYCYKDKKFEYQYGAMVRDAKTGKVNKDICIPFKNRAENFITRDLKKMDWPEGTSFYLNTVGLSKEKAIEGKLFKAHTRLFFNRNLKLIGYHLSEKHNFEGKEYFGHYCFVKGKLERRAFSEYCFIYH